MKFLKSFIFISALVISSPIAMAAGSNPDPVPTTGTVAETMISGGYLYMKLAENGVWIATNPLSEEVSAGDTIKFSTGMVMKDFHSKSLDRTFDTIYFVQNVSLAGQGSEQSGDAAPEHGMAVPVAPERPSIAVPEAGEITALTGGKTIGEIFASSAELKGTTVSLKAKVIKISKNIMGKNWITLQDGTGAAPDNKLLATSPEHVSPGDVVIAKGVLGTDIDIGAGYKYKVLLEDATFSPGLD